VGRLDHAPLGLSRAGQLFFHPVQLHFEPSDLLVQLGLQGLMVGRGSLAGPLEEVLGVGQELFLPGVDQGRVDLVLGGQCADRLVAAQGRQGHLNLERRRVRLPLACHRRPLSWTAAQ
jgi:hypothetical protein